MRKPLTYPERGPVLGFVLTWGALTPPLLLFNHFGLAQWGVVLADYWVEAMVILPAFAGAAVALYVFLNQEPPEPGDMDDPESWKL